MSVLGILFLCSIGVRNVYSETPKSRVVNINQGPVRGYKASGEDHFVFYGVPYATAPTGMKRFQAPLPPPTWKTPFEATKKDVICPQVTTGTYVYQRKLMQEDCLIANIYMPDNDKTRLPVIVYIHGGAFMWGYGDFKTPNNLMKSGKVVIVTFNYRLGAHGFLCLGTDDIPGNAGLKDQVALLRWVKKNIANFGGNPDDVTIAGYSAGAISADLLVISKMAKNLFNKVIPESGSNVVLHSIQSDPIESAQIYAKMLNFTDVNDLYALEEFYKAAPYEFLCSINLFEKLDVPFLFLPCVERDTGVERFLEDSPMHILKSGDFPKLPMLFGITTMEGLIRLEIFDLWKERINRNFSDYLPSDLRFASKEEKEQVATIVRQFYFGNNAVNDAVLSFVDYYSDIYFTYGSLKSVDLQVQAGNHQIYLYEYSYKDGTPFDIRSKVRGANHCAQTIAVLDEYNSSKSDESHLSEEYKQMKETVREIWLNFVTTGKPVPEGSTLPAWHPTGANHTPYMVLDNQLQLQYSPLLRNRYLFWNDIYNQFYRSPKPPSTPPSEKQRVT